MKKTTNVLAAVAAIGMFFTFAACSKTTDSASVGFKASRMATPLDLTQVNYAAVEALKDAMKAQSDAYPKGSEEAKWLDEQVRALTAAARITNAAYDLGKTAEGPSKIADANLLVQDAQAGEKTVTPGDKKLPTDSSAEGMEGVTVEWTAVATNGDHCNIGTAADTDNASVIIKDKNKADHKCECTIAKATGGVNDGKFQLHATISCGGYKCKVTCRAGANPAADGAKFTIKK